MGLIDNPVAVALMSAAAVALAAALAAWLLRPRLRAWAAGMPEDRRRDVVEVADRVHDFLEGVKDARPGGLEDVAVAFGQTFADVFKKEFGREPTKAERTLARSRAHQRHIRKGGSVQLRGPGME